MRFLLYLSVLFCFEIMNLHAQATSTIASSKTAKQLNADNQNQEAGWVIETSQVSKDFVDGIDRGQYAQSWSKADQLFQNTITQKEWATALNSSRKDLGNVRSRTLRDQRIAWNPKGLPAGAYMVVEYNTAFEKSASPTLELLTLRRGSDNKWRVLTYQIRSN